MLDQATLHTLNLAFGLINQLIRLAYFIVRDTDSNPIPWPEPQPDPDDNPNGPDPDDNPNPDSKTPSTVAESSGFLDHALQHSAELN